MASHELRSTKSDRITREEGERSDKKRGLASLYSPAAKGMSTRCQPKGAKRTNKK